MTSFSAIGLTAFAAAAITVPAFAEDAPATATAIQVANSGKMAIIAVYASPPGRADWGDDMIGKGPLKGGQTRKMPVKAKPEACKVDVMAMLDSGVTRTQKDVDLCAAAPNVGF
jgi:hypothetical protein